MRRSLETAPLSPQERQVAFLAEEGWSSKEIARKLEVSVGAVNLHLDSIHRKARVTTSDRREMDGTPYLGIDRSESQGASG